VFSSLRQTTKDMSMLKCSPCLPPPCPARGPALARPMTWWRRRKMYHARPRRVPRGIMSYDTKGRRRDRAEWKGAQEGALKQLGSQWRRQSSPRTSVALPSPRSGNGLADRPARPAPITYSSCSMPTGRRVTLARSWPRPTALARRNINKDGRIDTAEWTPGSMQRSRQQRCRFFSYCLPLHIPLPRRGRGTY